MFKWNLLYFSLYPLPFVLWLDASEKSLALYFSLPTSAVAHIFPGLPCVADVPAGAFLVTLYQVQFPKGFGFPHSIPARPGSVPEVFLRDHFHLLYASLLPFYLTEI